MDCIGCIQYFLPNRSLHQVELVQNVLKVSLYNPSLYFPFVFLRALCGLKLNHFAKRTQHTHQRRVIIAQQRNQLLDRILFPYRALLAMRFFSLQQMRGQHFANRNIRCAQDVTEIPKPSCRCERLLNLVITQINDIQTQRRTRRQQMEYLPSCS